MNRKLKDLLASVKSQKFQKIAAGITLLIILIAIPLTLQQVSTRQVPTQNASNTHTGGAQDFPCGPVTIKVFANEQINGSTTPNQCSSGSVTNLTSYKADFNISLENGSTGSYTAKWTISKNFCISAKSPCIDNQSNVPSGPSALPVNASTGWQSPNIGSACGFYQDDLSFQIFNSSGTKICQWGDMTNPATGNYCNGTSCLANAYYAICKATNSSGIGVTCVNVTPTPTIPINTPTPTLPIDTPTPTLPIDTPTPTLPVDTPTPTIPVDTPTPGLTITPTNTPSPSPTGTITPAPSDTPTPTTPNQPTSTPTTVIAITSPKPTLPPTGPGNTIVSIGLIGVVIVVAGLVFAVGL